MKPRTVVGVYGGGGGVHGMFVGGLCHSFCYIDCVILSVTLIGVYKKTHKTPKKKLKSPFPLHQSKQSGAFVGL